MGHLQARLADLQIAEGQQVQVHNPGAPAVTASDATLAAFGFQQQGQEFSGPQGGPQFSHGIDEWRLIGIPPGFALVQA